MKLLGVFRKTVQYNSQSARCWFAWLFAKFHPTRRKNKH